MAVSVTSTSGVILDPAVDRLCTWNLLMKSTCCSPKRIHPKGERATHGIAGPAGRLALLQILAMPPGIAAVCA